MDYKYWLGGNLFPERYYHVETYNLPRCIGHASPEVIDTTCHEGESHEWKTYIDGDYGERTTVCDKCGYEPGSHGEEW